MGNTESTAAAPLTPEQIYAREQKEAFEKYGIYEDTVTIKLVSAAINKFAFQLLMTQDSARRQSGATGGCLALAPVALFTLLAAAAAGTMHRSRAGEELSELVGLPLNFPATLVAVGNALRQILGASDPKCTLHMPMAVWIAAGIRKDYVDYVHQQLGVEVQRMSQNSRDLNWHIAHRTGMAIPELLPLEEYSRASACLLGCALHYRGTWSSAFASSSAGLFFPGSSGVPAAGANQQKVQCVFMARADRRCPYAEVWTGLEESSPGLIADAELGMIAPGGLVCQIVRLELGVSMDQAGGQYDAVILLPAPAVALHQLVAVLGLTPHRWDSWLAQLQPKNVETKLPRMRIRSSVTSVKEDLQTMGVTTVFDQFEPGALHGMSEDPDLHVQGMYHQVHHEIHPEGLQPANPLPKQGAMMTGGLRVLATSVVVDRPFLYAVVDRYSSALVTLAAVYHPEFILKYEQEAMQSV